MTIEQLVEDIVRRVVREELAKRDGITPDVPANDDIEQLAAERAAEMRRRRGGAR